MIIRSKAQAGIDRETKPLILKEFERLLGEMREDFTTAEYTLHFYHQPHFNFLSQYKTGFVLNYCHSDHRCYVDHVF